MSTDARLFTIDELWKLPDDHMRHELVDGEHRVMSPTGADHGRVAMAVGGLLFAHVRAGSSGVAFGAETGFVLRRDPDTVRAPDAAYVRRERAEAVGRTRRFWPEAPDFAAEVVSPWDTRREVVDKALDWLRSGTKLVLVLDPATETATVYRPEAEPHSHRAGETVDLSDAVPNWRLQLSEAFA